MTRRVAVALLAAGVLDLVVVVVLEGLRGVLPGRLPDTALTAVFAAVILFGSAVHPYESDRISRMGDVGATAALAFAVTYAVPAHRPPPDTLTVALVSLVGMGWGGWIAVRSSGVRTARVAGVVGVRVLTVVLVSTVLRDLPWAAGRPPTAWLGEHRTGPTAVLALTVLTYTAVLVEAAVEALLRGRRGRRPADPAGAVHTAVLALVPVSTAVLVAALIPVLGPAALPISLLPQAFNQAAVRRHDEMLRDSRQSVLALSRMPEAMGLVRPGHAARVAATSVELAHRLGMARRDIRHLERAALLHDLGQVHLDVPRPGGVTVTAAPAEQTAIADAGAEIARSSGVLDAEADLIGTQAVPYHHHVSHVRAIPLGSRILKVANAYDDLLTGDGNGLPLAGADAVLERLYLGLGHEYDPAAVDGLAQVVGVSGPGSTPGDGPRS